MFGKCRKRIKSLKNAVTDWFGYIQFLLNWPLIVFGIYFVLTGVASFYALYFHYQDISLEARKGFETRGTSRADERLALSHLIHEAATKRQVIPYGTAASDRIKRSIETLTVSSLDNFTINYDDYGNNNADEEPEITPCSLYLSLGTKNLTYSTIDALSKVIFEIENFEVLFEISTLKALCKLDTIIDRVVRETGLKEFLSPVPFSFNFPNYVMCGNNSYIKRCEDLDQNTANSFKSVVISCLNPQTEAEILNCETNFALELRDYILQRPATPGSLPKGRIYIGAVLRVWARYMVSAPAPSVRLFYSTLFNQLNNEYSNGKITLKGVFPGTKEEFFETALYSDIVLGSGALMMVILGILIYSKSLVFTLIVLTGMTFAVGASFFVYAAIFRISFFPFINLLVVVIAIAVGADDAFLLTYQFNKQKQELKHWNAKLLNFDPDLLAEKEKLGYSYSFGATLDFSVLDLQSRSQITKAAVHEALKHAAVSMFVTSATTAVAFLTNCFSSILILRCFGIFAAITILANYIFVISALPAALVLLHSPSPITCFSDFGLILKAKSCLTSISNIYIYRLPIFISKVFSVILLVSGLLFAGSIYVLCYNPGIRLPENNAMQLLRSHHPFEWFDEYEKRYFNFSSHRSFMLNFYAIWGVRPTTDSSWLIANDMGTLSPDLNFKLTKSSLKSIDSQIKTMKKADFIDGVRKQKNTTWAGRFLAWVEGCTVEECCLLNASSAEIPKSCVNLYSKDMVDYVKPSVSLLPRIQETALITKDTQTFIGILVQGPSKYPFTNTFKELQPFFGQLAATFDSNPNPKPMLLGTPDTTNLFDLLSTLLYGTTVSVAISLGISACVIALSTTRPLLSIAAILSIAFSISIITSILLLLGWTINVVEATILVITIGLSFDYSLHLAVAYKLSSDVVVTEKVREANEAAAVPIALASGTNIAAGVVLLFSQTQAFFEIGVFLIVMTLVSLYAAHFVFVSLIYLFSRFCSDEKV